MLASEGRLGIPRAVVRGAVGNALRLQEIAALLD